MESCVLCESSSLHQHRDSAVMLSTPVFCSPCCIADALLALLRIIIGSCSASLLKEEIPFFWIPLLLCRFPDLCVSMRSLEPSSNYSSRSKATHGLDKNF